MKKIYLLGLVITLIMILCSGCILPDGKPLTTESVTEKAEERYVRLRSNGLTRRLGKFHLLIILISSTPLSRKLVMEV